jgi:hypothetical protein
LAVTPSRAAVTFRSAVAPAFRRNTDSPDLLFRDLTDWSVVEANGFPDYRYNDREIIRSGLHRHREEHDQALA